jgi:hypothetical protein
MNLEFEVSNTEYARSVMLFRHSPKCFIFTVGGSLFCGVLSAVLDSTQELGTH